MYIRYLSLTHFRSWNTLELEFPLGSTIIIAPNGYGKTNILEAIVYSSIFESHRVATDKPLIKNNYDYAIISSIVVNHGREIEINIEISPGKSNRVQVNRSLIKNIRESYGILKVILFSPEDLLFVRGDPNTRRQYLDELISMQRPQLSLIRTDYHRVLRQKTALLKNLAHSSRDDHFAFSTLEIWNQKLIEYGSHIISSRLEILRILSEYISREYYELSSDSRKVDIVYQSPYFDDEFLHENPDIIRIQEQLFSELEKKKNDEIRRGICLVGPHRDDIGIFLGKYPAKGFASHGESWSIALSFKLASYHLLKDSGPEPVLLLDNVFTELDKKRAVALRQKIENTEQSIITESLSYNNSLEWAKNKIYLDLVVTDNDRYSIITSHNDKDS